MKKLLAFLSLSFLIACSTQLPGCASKGPKSGEKMGALSPKGPNDVSVMTFNVENLFDNVHDKNREDFAYLPLASKKTAEIQAGCNELKGYYKRECLEMDWNDSLVESKLKNVAEVIQSVEGKKGPDILFLIEVENENILGQLNKKLTESGYITQVLIEGPDERGIDVAVLSRFPVEGKAQLHKIPYKGENAEDQKWMNRSRGILEVPLKLPNGSILTAFVAHFPSQRNPRYWRAQSVAFMKEKLAGMKDQMFIFGGDLNISQDEEDETGFFKKELSSVAQVSHLVGCGHCDGSHEFRSTWSFLDALLFSNSMSETGTAPYKLIPESIDVVKYTKNHLYKGRAPKRFDDKTGEGVSDHFPIYARIRLR